MDDKEKNTKGVQPGDDELKQVSDNDLEQVSGGGFNGSITIKQDTQPKRATFEFWIRE